MMTGPCLIEILNKSPSPICQDDARRDHHPLPEHHLDTASGFMARF